MPLRRHRDRARAGALLVATLLLGSCGFGYQTDQVNNLTAGVSNREQTVQVLNALVVASRPGTGTLVAQLVNGADSGAATLTSVEAAGDPPVQVPDFGTVRIPAGQSLNLVDLAGRGGGIRLDGAFAAGDVVNLTLSFGSGEQVDLPVPVYPACDEYAGLDSAPTAAASSSAPAAGGTASPSATTPASASPAPSAYSCEVPQPTETAPGPAGTS